VQCQKNPRPRSNPNGRKYLFKHRDVALHFGAALRNDITRVALAVIPLALLTSGCSIALDEGIYNAADKFNFLDCSSLAQKIQTASAREAELTRLINGAAGGAEGQAIDMLAYEAELNSVRSELLEIRKMSMLNTAHR
jgi:hypothetical protein